MLRVEGSILSWGISEQQFFTCYTNIIDDWEYVNVFTVCTEQMRPRLENNGLQHADQENDTPRNSVLLITAVSLWMILSLLFNHSSSNRWSSESLVNNTYSSLLDIHARITIRKEYGIIKIVLDKGNSKTQPKCRSNSDIYSHFKIEIKDWSIWKLQKLLKFKSIIFSRVSDQ